MIVVDGHLDIGFNQLCFGRDPRDSALRVREREGSLAASPWRGKCMVGLPELRAGRVAVVFGTLFVPRAKEWRHSGLDPGLGYSDGAQAETLARSQLDLYGEISSEDGGYRVVGSASDLREVLEGWEDGATGDVGIVPLMEGADPIVHPLHAPRWFERGVRIVGLAWRRTRYSGGTGEPGPLTEDGRLLVRELDRAGLVLDLSHASDQSARDALELFDGPVIASHSNPRAVCRGDRQLPDEIIRAIAERGGVVGVVPFNGMLVEGWSSGAPEVPLERVAEAVHHVTQTAGTHEGCGIGSDFDGGFGAESAPRDLDTVADLPRIADPLADLDFTDDQIRDILGGNWIRFLERTLPADTD